MLSGHELIKAFQLEHHTHTHTHTTFIFAINRKENHKLETPYTVFKRNLQLTLEQVTLSRLTEG